MIWKRKKTESGKPSIIDVHCHILPGVDDGSQSFEESRKMLEIARSEGVRAMIATPHHHPKRGMASSEEILSEFKRLADNDYGIQLFYGSELLYREGIADKCANGEVLTMNGTKIVLVEFPENVSFSDAKKSADTLRLAGFRVMTAHVERYYNLSIDEIRSLAGSGVYLQVNASSIDGKNGKKTQKLIWDLMKMNLVTCAGSDAHDSLGRKPLMKSAYYKVSERFGPEYAHMIFCSNAEKLFGIGL